MAKFNVSTYSQLERVLQQATQESLRMVSLEVEKMIKEYVMDNLYRAYEPEEYLRSYNYINSLTVKKVSKGNDGLLETEIYFDPNKIYSNEIHDSYWNQHMSVNGNTTWRGRKISEWIPIWMEYGVSGSKWDRSGINVVENIIRKLDNDGEYKKFMLRELRRMGLDAI